MLNLRGIRKARGWTQEQLAYRAGLTVKTVARVEKTGRASHTTLMRLAKALDLEPAELFSPAEASA